MELGSIPRLPCFLLVEKWNCFSSFFWIWKANLSRKKKNLDWKSWNKWFPASFLSLLRLWYCCRINCFFPFWTHVFNSRFEFLINGFGMNTSEIRGLCLMKLSSEMFQNLPYVLTFKIRKAKFLFYFSFQSF